MPYKNDHLIRLEALKRLADITQSGLDTLNTFALGLRTQLQTLEARQDADITGATEDSEVIDARVDSWGNEHASLGTNIRNGQIRLSEAIEALSASLQAQMQELSEVRIEGLLDDAGAHERRKQEILQEAENRSESDSLLQTQIQQLSEASLRMSVMLSEIQETLRELKEE